MMLAGCQAFPIVNPVVPANAPTATVIVIRDSTPKIGEGVLYFGEGKQAYFVMSSKGVKQLELAAGSHQFVLSTKGSSSYKLEVELVAGSTTCIKVSSNEANYYGKALLPFLRNMLSEYVAQIIPCTEYKIAKR